ncbi:hypothetical protein SAVIM338S_02265 [Streptomyces avidinii]
MADDDTQWLTDAVDGAEGEWTRGTISHGNFDLWCFFRAGSAGTAPTHMFIRPVAGGDAAAQSRGITTTVLREINPAQEAHYLQQALEHLAGQEDNPLDAVLSSSKKPTDEYLAALSLRYEQLAESGIRSPVQRLVEITGKSLGTVKSHIQSARKKGYLEAVGTKAGGQATDAAHLLLGTAVKITEDDEGTT